MEEIGSRGELYFSAEFAVVRKHYLSVELQLISSTCVTHNFNSPVRIVFPPPPQKNIWDAGSPLSSFFPPLGQTHFPQISGWTGMVARGLIPLFYPSPPDFHFLIFFRFCTFPQTEVLGGGDIYTNLGELPLFSPFSSLFSFPLFSLSSPFSPLFPPFPPPDFLFFHFPPFFC